MVYKFGFYSFVCYLSGRGFEWLTELTLLSYLSGLRRTQLMMSCWDTRGWGVGGGGVDVLI